MIFTTQGLTRTVIAGLAAVFLAAAHVFDIPRPPLAACAAWIALAAALEALAVLGFILVFKLYRAVSLLLPVGLGTPAWLALPVGRVRRRRPPLAVAPSIPKPFATE